MITKKHKEMPQILTVNKKIAIIPSVIIVVIIVGISQVSLEYVPDEISEVEIVEELEDELYVSPAQETAPVKFYTYLAYSVLYSSSVFFPSAAVTSAFTASASSPSEATV